MSGPSLDDFCQTLTAAASGTDREALRKMSDFQQKNKLEYLKMVARVLGDQTRDARTRQLAGLQWKRLYESESEEKRQQRAQQWLRLDGGIRKTLKGLAWNGLKCVEKDVNRAAGQVIAQIALIELPENEWPDLIGNLLGIIKTEPNPALKVAGLTCIGYICQEMHELEVVHTQPILNALTFGMRKEVGNPEVIMAAATAFFHVIKLLAPHMDKPAERDYIMKTVCAATQIPNVQIRAKAMQILNRISQQYYSHMQKYIRHIVTLYTTCLEKDDPRVAIDAVEFWSGMCDLEYELYETNQRDATVPFYDFVGELVEQIVPPLLKVIVRKQLLEEEEAETWDLPAAAATCLSLIAGTIGSKVMGHVMPFVLQHVKSPTLQLREAGFMAFGCLLEGPKTEDVAADINRVLPVLVTAVETDSVVGVRDTAVWALARVCEFHAELIMDDKKLKKTLQVLCSAVKKDAPGVAALACYALNNIALACPDRDEDSSPLDNYFQPVIRDLLLGSERPDSETANLRNAAFDAITVFVQNASKASLPLINQLCTNFMGRLQKTFAMSASNAAEAELRQQLQGYICSVLLVVVQRLDEQIKPFAKNMLTLFLKIFQNAAGEQLVLEDALMAVGCVANALQGDFKPYVKALMPFCVKGIKEHEAAAVCMASVGAVGDMFRAVGNDIKTLCNCDEIVKSLIAAAREPKVDKSVKPHILSTCGDIANALGSDFARYYGAVTKLLQDAAKTKKRQNPDYDDWVDQLREGVIDGFTGIFQGLRDSQDAARCAPLLPDLAEFLLEVDRCDTTPHSCHLVLVGIIGDVAAAVGPPSKPFCVKLKNIVKKFQRIADEDADEELADMVDWSLEQMENVGVH